MSISATKTGDGHEADINMLLFAIFTRDCYNSRAFSGMGGRERGERKNDEWRI